MKVLFFIDSLRSGGKERRLVELIKGLSASSSLNMELVITKREIHYKEIYSSNIKIHYTLRKKGIRKDPRIFYEFYKIVKKFNPDIIHVWSNLTAIYAIPAKVLLQIPMVNNQITNATLQKSNTILSYRLTFPFSNRIVSNTFAGLKAYNAPKKKSSVIYNGFDFNRIKNLDKIDTVRQNFDIKTKYVVGMVASFNEKKDYYSFVKGAIEVLKSCGDVTFICIGSGNSQKCKDMVDEHLNSKVLFLGKQNNVESIMNICDLGVLMTNPDKHGEGISNAILEFSALGKPVIASDGGGNAEIIKNGISGFLISPKSHIELADRIKYFLNNNNEINSFGLEGKSIVQIKFSIAEMINKFISVYSNLVI